MLKGKEVVVFNASNKMAITPKLEQPQGLQLLMERYKLSELFGKQDKNQI